VPFSAATRFYVSSIRHTLHFSVMLFSFFLAGAYAFARSCPFFFSKGPRFLYFFPFPPLSFKTTPVLSGSKRQLLSQANGSVLLVRRRFFQGLQTALFSACSLFFPLQNHLDPLLITQRITMFLFLLARGYSPPQLLKLHGRIFSFLFHPAKPPPHPPVPRL